MSDLEYYKVAFNRMGWFIPPYVGMGALGDIAPKIHSGEIGKEKFTEYLSGIYSMEHLAAMIRQRYSILPRISEYKEIISESVTAHFLGLNHISVSGLMPVIEGAGRLLTSDLGVEAKYIKDVFKNLSEFCKNYSSVNKVLVVSELISMMDSFIDFTDNHLYIKSKNYPLDDNTNRHGILHGAYSDSDYGETINFYKSIGAIDILCFISNITLKAPVSIRQPTASPECLELVEYYKMCKQIGKQKP